MRLLLDFNLSPKLVGLLSDLFPDAIHLKALGFDGEAPDQAIWEFAQQNGFTILTSDSDFVELARRFGHPPKVIRLEGMNYRTQIAADLIRTNAVAIVNFEKSGRDVLLLSSR